MNECSAAGPHTNWPLQKGFDRFYGFLQGETDQFAPELTLDNTHIDPPARPPTATTSARTSSTSPWAGSATSSPSGRTVRSSCTSRSARRMRPTRRRAQYIDKYRGKFDDGWDVAREEWFARQLELGVVPAGTTLAPRNPGVPPWDELTDNQQAFAARLQEAFAGFLEHTDAQIGRLVDFLELHGSARQHDGHGDVRQRRQPGRRRLRSHGRVQLLQPRARGHRRHRRQPPRRHRRPALAQQLSLGLGAGRQHAAALVQAEHLRRRRARPAHHPLPRRHPGARRKTRPVLPRD